MSVNREALAGEVRGRLLVTDPCSREARELAKSLRDMEHQGEVTSERPSFARSAAAVVAAVVLSGCASAPADRARAGVAADVGSSAAVLAFSNVAREANPAALALLPLRLALVDYAEREPKEVGVPVLHFMQAQGWGLAVWALCTAQPVCIVPAVFVGGVVWQSGADERAFVRECARHVALAGHELRCDFNTRRG